MNQEFPSEDLTIKLDPFAFARSRVLAIPLILQHSKNCRIYCHMQRWLTVNRKWNRYSGRNYMTWLLLFLATLKAHYCVLLFCNGCATYGTWNPIFSLRSTEEREERNLVDQAGCRTNPAYLVDLIKYFTIPKQVDIEQIRDFYLKHGLTARQIAVQLGVSRTFILSKLHSLGIRRDTVKNLQVSRSSD